MSAGERATNSARVASVHMTSEHPPKSPLLAHGPQCPHCTQMMKVRTLLPGRKINDVAYRCQDCGEEGAIGVPRG